MSIAQQAAKVYARSSAFLADDSSFGDAGSTRGFLQPREQPAAEAPKTGGKKADAKNENQKSGGGADQSGKGKKIVFVAGKPGVVLS